MEYGGKAAIIPPSDFDILAARKNLKWDLKEVYQIFLKSYSIVITWSTKVLSRSVSKFKFNWNDEQFTCCNNVNIINNGFNYYINNNNNFYRALYVSVKAKLLNAMFVLWQKISINLDMRSISPFNSLKVYIICMDFSYCTCTY